MTAHRLRPARLAILILLLAATTAAPGAAADGAYQAGDGFQLGGVYFHVVSISSDGGALFRVTERLTSDGSEEHADCYRVARSYYHHEACPVVQAHFARHGDDPASAPSQSAVTGSGGGSHPIDYVRGSYEERDESFDWSNGGLFFHPWYGTSVRVGFGGRRGAGLGTSRRFGARGRSGRAAGSFVHLSFRRW